MKLSNVVIIIIVLAVVMFGVGRCSKSSDPILEDVTDVTSEIETLKGQKALLLDSIEVLRVNNDINEKAWEKERLDIIKNIKKAKDEKINSNSLLTDDEQFELFSKWVKELPEPDSRGAKVSK